jgi:hypothetical protein
MTSVAEALKSFEVTLSQKVRLPAAVVEMVPDWDTLPFARLRLPRRAKLDPVWAVPLAQEAWPENAHGDGVPSKPPFATRLGVTTTLLTVTLGSRSSSSNAGTDLRGHEHV